LPSKNRAATIYTQTSRFIVAAILKSLFQNHVKSEANKQQEKKEFTSVLYEELRRSARQLLWLKVWIRTACPWSLWHRETTQGSGTHT